MNIPTATAAHAAALECRVRIHQKAISDQAALIEQGIQKAIANGELVFSHIGELDSGLKTTLGKRGYQCRQFNEYREDCFYSIEWKTPNRATL